MTLSATPQGAWALGQYALVTIAVTGANPVHAVSVDFPNDGQPAWYFVVTDARPSAPYRVGPLKTAGRFALVVNARDERGCEIAHVPGLYITVTR